MYPEDHSAKPIDRIDKKTSNKREEEVHNKVFGDDQRAVGVKRLTPFVLW